MTGVQTCALPIYGSGASGTIGVLRTTEGNASRAFSISFKVVKVAFISERIPFYRSSANIPIPPDDSISLSNRIDFYDISPKKALEFA